MGGPREMIRKCHNYVKTVKINNKHGHTVSGDGDGLGHVPTEELSQSRALSRDNVHRFLVWLEGLQSTSTTLGC